MKMKNSFKIFLSLMVMGTLVIPSFSRAQSKPSLSLIRDTEIELIIKEWATPIFEAAHLNPDHVKIILVQSDQMNAFVAGGSNIFIYTGLIEKTDNPGELIGVIAHETGHIAGGHLIRTREALERASYESIIGMIIGIGAAIASGDAGAVSAISAGGTSLAQRSFFAHSRIQESSADQAALTFMEESGINPEGMKSFMQKLEAENYVPKSQQSEYIRTHPLVDNRIEAMNHRISESKNKDKPYPKKWVEQLERVRAKLIGFIHPGQTLWKYDDKDQSIAADYARAIASYRENKSDEAIKKIDGLIAREPNNPYFLELKGQMLVDFGRVREAVPFYRKAMTLLPNGSLLRIALAHALIESTYETDEKILREAIENLEHALHDEPRNARVHRLLATAYGRLSQENRAKLHLAEEAVLQRSFEYAKQHAEAILAEEPKGTSLWIKAKDIISFIEIEKKG